MLTNVACRGRIIANGATNRLVKIVRSQNGELSHGY